MRKRRWFFFTAFPSARPGDERSHHAVNTTLWLLGFACGLLADQVFFLALSWSAAHVATPSSAGLIVGIGALPRALLLPLGGALTDRLSPKPISLCSDAARVITLLLFVVLLFITEPAVPLFLALALVFGTIDAFFLPAVSALPHRMVSTEKLPRVQSFRSLVQRLTAVFGPPLGGLLLTRSGLLGALIVNALLFTVSFILLRSTTERSIPYTVKENEGGSDLFREAFEGLRCTLTQADLRLMLVLIVIGESASVGSFTTGLPLLAIEKTWTAADISIVLSSFAVGAGASALLITIRPVTDKAGVLTALAITLMGPTITGIGIAPGLSGAIGSAALAGSASGVCATLLTTMFLVRADWLHAGRVMSTLALAIYLAAPLSYTAAGMISEYLSAAAVFTVSGILVTATGLMALCSDRIRSLHL